ncbi:MAG: hypothetical protein U0V70_11865 [Terriglobia bacterium]
MRWVHCEFAVSVEALGTATFYLRELVSLPEFPSPIGIMPRGRDFEVITGPLRMVLLGNSNQLLDQVWVDEGWGYNFSEANKILDSGNFRLSVTCNGHTYPTSDWKKTRVTVEAVSALRAVIRVEGSFNLGDQNERAFNYVARITLYGGKTYFKMDLTVIDESRNPEKNSLPFEDLSLELKLNLDPSQQKFAFGGGANDIRGDFLKVPMATLSQLTPREYKVTGAVEYAGAVEEGQGYKPGWVDLSDDGYGLSVGVRWFPRLFPKGFEVRNDGTLAIRLAPFQVSGVKISKRFCRTHELLFHFHGQRDLASGQVRNNLTGFQSSLYGTVPAALYLNDSVGPLVTELKPKLDPDSAQLKVIPLYDAWQNKNREVTSTAMRERDQREASAVFCFGDSLHFVNDEVVQSPPGQWLQAVGDFPHALYLQFQRTGELKSLELAEESLSYTMDFTVARPIENNPMNPNGGRGFLRFYQIEGLLDSYLITGNARCLAVARKSLQDLLGEDDHRLVQSPARLGNALLCLARGFEVLGDRQFLDRSMHLLNAFVEEKQGRTSLASPNPSGLNAESRQNPEEENERAKAWQYGILWDGYQQAGRASGEKVYFDRIREEAIELFEREQDWDNGRRILKGYPPLTLLLALGIASLEQSKPEVAIPGLAFECFRHFEEASFVIQDPGTYGLLFSGMEKYVGLLELQQAVRKKADSKVP